MIILDTNVISELLRPSPATRVKTWLSAQDGSGIYFTAIGEAELRSGVALLPAGKRRAALWAARSVNSTARSRRSPARTAPVQPPDTVDYEGCGIPVTDPWNA